jgi:endonuclease/exonuclease/phosphatase family metal-dependent hydrolase
MAGFRKDALACTVMYRDGAFRLVAVHLDHRGQSATVPAAQVIVDYVRQQSLSTVVAGDLNATPSDWPNPRHSPTALDVLRASGLFKYPPQPCKRLMTYPANAPRVKLDWVLIPREWEFKEYKVLPVVLSDHRPVMAEI